MLMSENEFISIDSEVPCTAVLEDDDILDMVRDHGENDSDVEITEIMALIIRVLWLRYVVTSIIP